mgnify:CR=1 FL=1
MQAHRDMTLFSRKLSVQFTQPEALSISMLTMQASYPPEFPPDTGRISGMPLPPKPETMSDHIYAQAQIFYDLQEKYRRYWRDHPDLCEASYDRLTR